MHATIRAVSEDIDHLRFNTAIAKLMEMANALTPLEARPRRAIEAFVLLLSPFAPHIAEEMWRVLGHEASLAYAEWPSFDPALAADQLREYAIQVNGKLRRRMVADAALDAAALARTAKADAKVAQLLEGKTILREIAIEGRLVNFVVAGAGEGGA